MSLLNKRPVHVPQYSLTPKTEWRLVSRSLKRSINHAATGHPRGRMERREKGVLTAGHTRTTFQGECPHKGYFTPSLISMFCVLSQNCQHGFKQLDLHLKANCPRNSKWHWNFSRPSRFKLWIKAVKICFDQ